MPTVFSKRVRGPANTTRSPKKLDPFEVVKQAARWRADDRRKSRAAKAAAKIATSERVLHPTRAIILALEPEREEQHRRKFHEEDVQIFRAKVAAKKLATKMEAAAKKAVEEEAAAANPTVTPSALIDLSSSPAKRAIKAAQAKLRRNSKPKPTSERISAKVTH